MLGPSHDVGELLGTAQGLGIEKVLAVERDARKDAVVQFVLDVIDIFGIHGGLEQTP